MFSKIHKSFIHVSFREDLDKKIVGFLAAAFEYYSFYITGYLQFYFLPQFLPASENEFEWWSNFFFYTCYFICLPLGAIIFGHLGDRKGRKQALILAITLTSIAPFLIAMLPSFEKGGYLSLYSLLILRMIQTIGIGGESGGLITFIMEESPRNKRGLFSGIISSGCTLGVIIASIAVSTHNHGIIISEFTWGWRIFFMLTLLGIPLALYIQLKFEETKVFQSYISPIRASVPVLSALRSKSIILIFFLLSLVPILNLTIFSYIPSLFSTRLGFPTNFGWYLNTAGLIIYSQLVVYIGYKSDKFGSWHMLKIVSVCFIFVSIPIFAVMAKGNTFLFIFSYLVLIYFCSVYYPTSLVATYLISPPELRYTVIGLGGQLTMLVFGSVIGVPFIEHSSEKYSLLAPSVYIVFGAILVFFTTKYSESIIKKVL